MHRPGSRSAPFVLPFVFGGPPQTPNDLEHHDGRADAQARHADAPTTK